MKETSSNGTISSENWQLVGVALSGVSLKSTSFDVIRIQIYLSIPSNQTNQFIPKHIQQRMQNITYEKVEVNKRFLYFRRRQSLREI